MSSTRMVRLLVWRRANQGFETNAANMTIDARYMDVVKEAAASTNVGSKIVEPADDIKWQARAGQLRPATPGGPA